MKRVLCLASGTMVLGLVAFAQQPGGELVARVAGRDITAGDFSRTYQAQLQAYRKAYGANLGEEVLKQLGLEQQVLQQMIDEQASLVEAERLGIVVSDEDVLQRILAIPAFQENGAFIGAERYRYLLNAQSPPLTAAQFEHTVRGSLAIEKLRALLTDSLSVADNELEQEYRLRHDTVKLAVVSFPTDSFRSQATTSDREVASYFDLHKTDFTIPEKRKARILLVDVDVLRGKVTVTAADIARAYTSNIEQYTTPEQVRASHILVKTVGKDDASVRRKADEILSRAMRGADFGELARTYSEDEGSAKNGGDLEFFGRNQMVPEFETAVFAMQPGQISGPIKTEQGYHIVKLVDRKAAAAQPLADVSQQISDQLRNETARAQASDLARTLAKEISTPGDFSKAATAYGLTVQESGFFTREETMLSLGLSAETVARVFDMKVEEVAGPLQATRGLAFVTLAARADSYVPTFQEVKDRVRDEVIRRKARDLSRQKAAGVATTLARAPDFEKAASSAGVDAKTTDFIARDAPVPDLGVAPEVADVAFRLPVGAVSDPIVTEMGTAIVKALEKKEVSPIEWAANKDRFRADLLAERQNGFFTAYMAKAKQRMTIEIYVVEKAR